MRPPSLDDPLLLLLAGLAIDALFGDMQGVFRFVPHPIVAGRAGDRLFRAQAQPANADRAARAASAGF